MSSRHRAVSSAPAPFSGTVPVSDLTVEETKNAGKLSLRRGPKSPEATAFVDGLLADIVLPAWPSGKAVRPSSVAKAKTALGALMADLLKLEAEDRAGAYGASPKDFVSLGFSLDIFLPIRAALAGAGLIRMRVGYQRFHNFTNRTTGQPGSTISHGGEVTRYRLAPLALEGARSAGVELEAWQDHWGRVEPGTPAKPMKPSTGPVVVLRSRAETVQGRRRQGRDMVVDEAHPKVAAFISDLKEHNAFMMAAGVGGVAFRGLRRIFHDGDLPGFDWQRGGRFYSVPDGPEKLDGATRRSVITIGGERVGEADLKAAQLCILYALKGLALDPSSTDPYTVAGVDRDIVKDWITKALGSGNVEYARWPRKAQDGYAAAHPGHRLSKDVPVATVREAMLARHPVLKHLGEPGFRAVDLQYHESEVMRRAMALLRQQGTPSLPVHDSLVVPVGALEDAAAAIRQAFAGYFEELNGKTCPVVPAVQLKGPED
jgi:hypothetical protein